MLKFGERYKNDWFGNVYPILLNDKEVGVVDYEENDDKLELYVLSFECEYKQFNYFEEAVNILKSMFPGKNIVGNTGIVSYCGRKEYWEALGSKTRPDPDDDIYTIFELENK